MELQIGWCNKCDAFLWGPASAIAVCPRCNKRDKIKRAKLGHRASAIFLKMVRRDEEKIVRPSDERLIKTPDEVRYE